MLKESTPHQKFLALLLVIGAFLRLYLIADKSIWLDEAFSITISQHTLGDMLRLVVQTDTHPPLYYLLLKFWLIFGEGEAQVRLLSAIFSLASIPVMYKLGASLFEDERAGLIGAAILTFSPFQVWYAQEARMYAMLTFFMLASAYFFIRALRHGDRRDWIGYVLTSVLALYTDNGAIWYLITITAFFLVFSIQASQLLPATGKLNFKPQLKQWLISTAAIGFFYLPWLPFFWRQTRQVTEDFWLQPPSIQTVLGSLLDFHSLSFPLIELSLIYMAAILVWTYITPKKAWQISLASMWFFTPLLISLLLSLRQPIFLSRNLIAASLGYYLLVAGIIWQFRSPKAAFALLAPLVVMNLISIGVNAWVVEKEDWRAAAGYVAQKVQNREDGLLVFLPSFAELPFDYYFKRYDVLVDTQGYPGDEILLHPEPKEVESLNGLLDGQPYIWLVVRAAESTVPDWDVKEWLDSNGYVRQKDLVIDELTVLTYYRWDKAPVSRSRDRPTAEPKAFLPMVFRELELQTYAIRPGESLLEIALRFDTTVQVLMDANELQDPGDISGMRELLVPK